MDTRLASWLAILVVAFVAACNSPPTITPEPGVNPTINPEAEVLTIEVLNKELAVGEERLTFRIQDASGNPVGPEAEVETVIFRILSQTNEAVRAASGPAVYFGQGMPGGGQWVIYAPFDSSGEWGIQVDATRPDGWTGSSRFNVQVAGDPSTPRLGELPPSGDNPTVDDGPLESITTDPNPEPDLYDLTIAAATENDRLTVVHFSSPEHCATELCGAVLDEIKATAAEYGSRVDFIHVETRNLDDPGTLSETAEAWGLPSEPWTFVLGRNGRVLTRAEGSLDDVELGLILDRHLAQPGT